MVCKHFLLINNPVVKNGKITINQTLKINHTPYLKAICKLELLLTKIFTVNYRVRRKTHLDSLNVKGKYRRSWVFNDLLNNSRFTPYYWRIKKKLFNADIVIF